MICLNPLAMLISLTLSHPFPIHACIIETNPSFLCEKLASETFKKLYIIGPITYLVQYCWGVGVSRFNMNPSWIFSPFDYWAVSMINLLDNSSWFKSEKKIHDLLQWVISCNNMNWTALESPCDLSEVWRKCFAHSINRMKSWESNVCRYFVDFVEALHWIQ